ncbi:MAG: trigger factor [Propionibacteriaceae bacterium]
MPSTVEQLSPSRVKITIEVPFADLGPSMDKAYVEIAKQVNVPGFRSGKVPPRVIDQRFGRGTVMAEAFNTALPDFYGRAVTENNLTPLAQPEIAVTKLEDGELIEFTAEVDVRPDFELPDLTHLTATVEAIEVTDEQVEEEIDALRQRFGTLARVERAGEDGDIVILSLTASRDGEVLDDATAEDLSYRIGAGGMIDGLDEAITGLSAGESNTFTADLLGGTHAGEPAQIDFTIAKVQEQQLPEVDGDFAQMASEFDTVEELTSSIRDRLTGMARLEQASQARDNVLEAVIADLDFEVPERIAITEAEARHQQIEQQLAQSQMTLEQYLTDVEDGKSAEEFWAEVDERSTQALKAQIVLDKLSDESNIQVDQNDLTQHILRIAQQNRQNPDEVAKHMVEHNHLTEYMTEIRRGKALASIVASAEVTDSNGEVVDLKNLRPDGTIGDPEADAAALAQMQAAAAAQAEDADPAVIEGEPVADQTDGTEDDAAGTAEKV